MTCPHPRAALDDAGVDLADVDGVGTYPDSTAGRGRRDGLDLVSVEWLVRAFGLDRQLTWWTQTSPGMIAGTLVNAIHAIAGGACTYALVWRAMANPDDGAPYFGFTAGQAAGPAQFGAPYGLTRGPMTFAMGAVRYQRLFGATRSDIATFVVNSRRNGSMHPHGYRYRRPLSLDDYLRAPIIWEPYSSHDFACPVNGATAVLLARADVATGLRHPPAYITGYGQSGWMNGSTPTENMWATAESIGRGIWRTSGLGPRDVDAAMLYDGYSHDVYFWLEGMGFCERGEAFRFIQDGRIGIDGELPLNTFGGSLSEGRLHGLGHLIEATQQVTGRAGQRQVTGAENVPVTIGPNSVGAGFMISRNPI